MKKWVKTTLIVAPLVMGTSIYAFASDRSAAQASVQISEVQPADTVSASNVSVPEVPSIANPFIVNKDQIMQEVAALQNGTQSQSSQPVSIEQIRKLHIKAKTDRGDLQLDYTVEGNGTARLNGEIGELKVSLTGDKAKEALNALLTRWELFDSLQKVLADPNVKLDGKILLALQEFELETADGKKITLDDQKLKANAEQAKKQSAPIPKQLSQPVSPPANGIANGQHKDDDSQKDEDKDNKHKEKHEDNGKHKGQEKHDKHDD